MFARLLTTHSSMASRTTPPHSRRHIKQLRRARSSTCRMASRCCSLRPAGVSSVTKRVKWIVDGTHCPTARRSRMQFQVAAAQQAIILPGIVVGNSSISVEVSQNGSQPTDFAVAHSSYIVNHSGGPTGGAVIANTRNDTIIYNSPGNFVWGGIDRLLWCGTQTPSGSSCRRARRALRADDQAECRPGFVGQGLAAAQSLGRVLRIPGHHRPAIQHGGFFNNHRDGLVRQWSG